MNDELLLTRRRVRRAFERAAPCYDAHAVLQREIGARMLERLDYVKITPRAVLDAGSGTGAALPALRRRYPRSALYALDIAPAMLARARRRVSWWQRLRNRDVRAVCGDFEQLPLRAAGIGLLWSNLTLQWTITPERAFAEARRVLEPGGLFMFSTFGPDTLRELRDAYAGSDDYAHVNRFIDMHDLGDLLVRGGFADPVMDMEYLTLTYPDVRALLRDLKALGAHTVIDNRRPTVAPRALLARVERNYEALRRDGRLPATFEIVYGHAWAPPPRAGPGGRRVIDIRAVP
ncbi:MAG TPA: malonyl-ACP O-methyltransferase BioC [Burkholderiales bacterium]|nr:malonyl-ACP O-methyltransferase BioC [Burkholderiales bacterium]